MIRRTARFILDVFGAALAGAAILIALLVWRISTEPVSLAFLSPYLQETLSAEDGSFTIEMDDTILNLCKGMDALGVNALDRVAVFGPNTPRWIMATFSGIFMRGTFVPIYPSSKAEDVWWILHDASAKVVFCHEELHHTRPEGSGQGGDVPFPPVGKEVSYVDNGWELREMFEADGNVAAVFAGHKHRSRWTVYGGVNYVTLAALHWECSYARVTLSERLHIEGVGGQRNYTLPLPAVGG